MISIKKKKKRSTGRRLILLLGLYNWSVKSIFSISNQTAGSNSEGGIKKKIIYLDI